LNCFDKIIYNGEEVAKVWMPVNALGEIDFNLLPLFQAAEEEIKSKIQEYKNDLKHTKSPSNLGHLRERISSSIDIYSKYES
jgi:hypothetical protein